ncbi:MAG: Purine nucleoside phosphoramidase [Eubacteriales bacterium SKADARSKE-1]|nr:Purine nucleoside phosphoramidase [Eubacteriales bacterium SKADARSKE-1]
MDCVFCKIVNNQISAKKVYEDEKVLAFYDLEPAAPEHILIIPKEHISSANQLTKENCNLVGHIFFVASKLASELGIDDGYRIVNNCGEDAGQSVKHLHFHLLGGRKFTWPPG